MKLLLTFLLFALTSGILPADVDKQTLAKVKWALIGADQVKIEAEAESIVERGTSTIPISPSANKYLLCSTDINLSDGTVEFRLYKPSPPMGLTKEAGGYPLIELLNVERPFRNGEEMVLLKSSGFTVLATISFSEANEATPAPKVQVVEPASKALSAEELKRVEIKTRYFPDDERFIVTGYNPFERSLGEGVLQVLIPKTENKPETFREYRFSAQGRALADFTSEIGADLDLAPGVDPVCRLVRLEFAK